jgi:hypothetical protein
MPAEADRVASVGPILTEGCGSASPWGAAPAECTPDDPGILIVDDDCKISR